jgi:hypothetical protein
MEDLLYNSFDRSLYKISGGNNSVIDILNADNFATTAGYLETPADSISTGVDVSQTEQIVGSLKSGKATYTDTRSGYFLGVVNGVPRFTLGDATNSISWNNGTLSLIGGSLNINNKSIIDSQGNATFIEMTSLNMKAYTCFEASTRFIVTGDVAPDFANQGMLVAPGATAGHYSRCLWYITKNIFLSNPTFVTSLIAYELNESALKDASAFIGLGVIVTSGSGMTFVTNHCGFYFRKSSIDGVTTFYSSMNNSSANRVGNSIGTIATGDSLELFVKMKTSSVDFYYRKNGGSLVLGDTLTTQIPTTAEDIITFAVSNMQENSDFKLQIQSAAYEH